MFRRSYLTTIHLGAYRASELVAATELDEKSRKSASKDLGKKALERWECILHYVALPSQKSEKGVSGTTKQLFKSAGLTSGGDGEIALLFDACENIGTCIMLNLNFPCYRKIGTNAGLGEKFQCRERWCSCFVSCATLRPSHFI